MATKIFRSCTAWLIESPCGFELAGYIDDSEFDGVTDSSQSAERACLGAACHACTCRKLKRPRRLPGRWTAPT